MAERRSLARAQIAMRFFATVHSFDMSSMAVEMPRSDNNLKKENLKAWASPHVIHVDAALKRSRSRRSNGTSASSPDIDQRAPSRSATASSDISPTTSVHRTRYTDSTTPNTGFLKPSNRAVARTGGVDEAVQDIYELIAGKAKVLAPSFSTFGSPCRLSSLRANTVAHPLSSRSGSENCAPGEDHEERKGGLSRSSLQRRLAQSRDSTQTAACAAGAGAGGAGAGGARAGGARAGGAQRAGEPVSEFAKGEDESGVPAETPPEAPAESEAHAAADAQC